MLKIAKGPARHLIKIAVGALLVYYVLHSKMIDFGLVRSLLMNPSYLVLALLFQAASSLFCASRWYLLVRAQGLSLSLVELIELTMIGNFFNTFMPGAVGGDLIKAWYVAGQEPLRKTKAVFTVLVDRAIGLAVIVFYSAATLVVYAGWIANRPELRLVAAAVWGFTSLCLLAGVIFYVPGVWEWFGFARLMNWLRRYDRLFRLVDAAVHYQHHLPTMLSAIVLSALSVLGLMLLYRVQGNAMGISMGLERYFFIVPLAMTASAIPLLPGGIGVGQVAFFTLFQWTGAANPQQGASLCTVMQAYTILFNCLGAIFYFKFKGGPKKTPVDLKTPQVVTT